MKAKYIFVVAAVSFIVTGLFWAQDFLEAQDSEFETPYQVVWLTNNQAYIGKLEKLNSKFPILRDVHYVQSQVNQQTKQPNMVLIQREKQELYRPPYMILNVRHIVSIEPVKPNSPLAQSIEALKGK